MLERIDLLIFLHHRMFEHVINVNLRFDRRYSFANKSIVESDHRSNNVLVFEARYETSFSKSAWTIVEQAVLLKNWCLAGQTRFL